MIAGEPILAIDTATTRVIVAIGQLDGTILEATDWPAGYRHGETLLPAIDQSLMRLGVERSRIGGVVVGTGPGAFTGLRVGLATAKGLAQALQIPIVGVSTADAILAAAPEGSVLLLPAGPSDRLIARRDGLAQLLPAGSEPDLAAHETLVAVDLEGRAPDDAIARGELARSVLGRSMLRLGGALLTAGDVDDVAMLVPDYVTLPRGVQSESGEVAWSHDRR